MMTIVGYPLSKKPKALLPHFSFKKKQFAEYFKLGFSIRFYWNEPYLNDPKSVIRNDFPIVTRRTNLGLRGKISGKSYFHNRAGNNLYPSHFCRKAYF
jgi:hypothetical protein